MRITNYSSLIPILTLFGFTPIANCATNNVAFGGSANTFRPATLNITQGDTVVWTLAGGLNNHTITAQNSEPMCGGSSIVSSCTWTFNNPGSFSYECLNHIGMTGQVNVAPAPVPVVPAVLTNITVLSNGQSQFEVFSTAMHTNLVQATTNVAGSNWTTISTVVPATTNFVVTDSNAPSFQLRFYRVVQP